MLTRDISRRRLRLAASIESVSPVSGSSCGGVVIGCKD